MRGSSPVPSTTPSLDALRSTTPTAENNSPAEVFERLGGWGRFQTMHAIISWAAGAVISSHLMLMYYVEITDVFCPADELPCQSAEAPDFKAWCAAGGPNNPDGFAVRHSIQAEWGCDEGYIPLSKSIFFFGWFVGVLLFGRAGDVYGRRLALGTSFAALGAALCFVAAAGRKEVYVFAKFIHGMVVGPTLLFNYVYGGEFIPLSKSTLYGTVYFMIAAFGSASVALLAYTAPEWRRMSLVVAFATFPLTLWPWVSPESPTWLVSVKLPAKAKAAFTRVARINGVSLPSVYAHTWFTETPEPRVVHSSCIARVRSALTLVRLPRLRRITVGMTTAWFGCGLAYFGLAYCGVSLPGNVYVNGALLSLSEVPVYPVLVVVMERPKVGRKGTTLGSVLVATAICFSYLFPLGDAARYLAFGGQMFITAAFTAVYIWAAEVFPADIRTTGLGLCTAAGKLGSMISPFWVFLAKRSLTIAMVVLGALTVLTAFASSFVPETLNNPAPTSISDMARDPFHPVLEDQEELLQSLPDLDVECNAVDVKGTNEE